LKRFNSVEADFQRFYGLDPLSLTWRRFVVLLFSLVSEESAFYAPYMREMYEEYKEEMANEKNQTPKVQISLEEAMDDLGV